MKTSKNEGSENSKRCGMKREIKKQGKRLKNRQTKKGERSTKIKVHDKG